MAAMPGLQKQNAAENTKGHGVNKISAVLPEMQTRKLNKRKKLNDNRYKRAGCLDTEPISQSKLETSAFLLQYFAAKAVPFKCYYI